MIAFTDDEKALITELSIPGGWDDNAAKPLKAKIKKYLLKKTAHCCCYCRLSMYEWHGLTIDPEHVLPKAAGKFPQLSFELRNLSVSCKRCNMGIKKQDTSFYIAAIDEADPFKSEHYEFIHPNLDAIDDHLRVISLQIDANRMVKYQVVNASAKGLYAYNYFKLQMLELNSFDRAQGLEEVLPSESLPPEVAIELRVVLGSSMPPIT